MYLYACMCEHVHRCACTHITWYMMNEIPETLYYPIKCNRHLQLSGLSGQS